MGVLEPLGKDARYAVRRLLRRPGFALIALLTLGLGMGAATTMFSVVTNVIIRPLPFPDSDRLVQIFQNRRHAVGALQGRIPGIFGNDLGPWREQMESLSGLATYGLQSATLSGRGEPVRLSGAEASPDLFPLLGVRPFLGRLFTPEEELRGSQKVILISYSAWQRHLGSDPGILNQTLKLDDDFWRVVGVMPASFAFPDESTEYWIPALLSSQGAPVRDINILPAVARIKPGYSLEEAIAESNTIFQRLRDRQREAAAGMPNEARRLRIVDRLADAKIELVTLQELIVGPVRPALYAMLAGVFLLLLIACVNVANLLLSRAAGREQEILLRSALGASRRRLASQLATESVVLGLGGGGVGAAFAWFGVKLLQAFQPAGLPRVNTIALDLPALGFCGGVGLLTALLFGSVPAFKLLGKQRREASTGRLQRNRFLGNAPRSSRALSLLALAEISMALILLVGAGLLVSSFLRLSNRDPGFVPDNTLTFQLALPESRYPEDPQRKIFFDQLIERLDLLRGLQFSGIVNLLPFQSGILSRTLDIVGRPRAEDPASTPFADLRLVSPEYFRALGIPLRSGRTFGKEIREGQPRVIVVNRALVSRYLAGEEAIGQRIRFGQQEFEIIGVVGNVRHRGLDSEAEPVVYFSYLQAPTGLLRMLAHMNIVLRTRRDLVPLVAQLRSEVASLDPEIALEQISTLQQRLYDSVAGPRFNMFIVGIFGILAVTLACIGIWGVMAYRVSQKTHEIGVRMALGAGRSAVLRSVFKQGFLLVAGGIGLGLVGAVLLSRYLETLLFDTPPLDLATFSIVSLLLAGVGLLACYLPARHATRIDPSVALRNE